MPTTFNWIYLGIPRSSLGTAVIVDPLETTSGAENAAGLLTAQNNLGPRVFGSLDTPLYGNITSATMINRSGEANALETNTALGSQVDQFSTNIGAGTQTFNFDALVNYTGTMTYADGTTATNVTLQLVQAETGELFLAPPASTATNAPLTAKPIASIRLDAVANNNVNLLVDRQLGIFDDGFVDGTSGNDSIGAGYIEPGTNGSDQIDGGDGISSPATGFNDDRIRAGAGNDTIDGGLGNDLIDAGDGNDLVNLTGTFGNDTITGGTGSDTLSGASFAAGQGATVTYTNGSGTFASSGGTASFNTIESIVTGAGADAINASTNAVAASFAMGAGNDSFTGGLGAETVDGGAGDDVIVSGGGNDSILAGDGNDRVEAEDGDDYVDAGTGNDTVDGGIGNDTLLGGIGDDQLSGGAGSDSLFGGAGNDVLLGGDGNDYLEGGAGADTLTGGAGNDFFAATSGDLITDFTVGDTANNDSVDLTGFYNATNLAIINAQRATLGLRPYESALGWLKADQADDGVLNSIRTDAGFSENFTLRIQNGGTAVSASDLTENATAVVCFGADAMIATADGPVPAGALKVADMVLTRDNGYQPIRWVGQRTLDAATLAANAQLRPIRIRTGALGQGLPTSDLIVSPQHRILVRSKIAERMFGHCEVLVAAKQLMVTEGIDIADDLESVTYVHFLFDAHQIVLSNGAETESLYTGAEALKSVPREAQEEILAVFPELAEGNARPAVREMLSGRMGRKLAQRHAQNGKKLVA